MLAFSLTGTGPGCRSVTKWILTLPPEGCMQFKLTLHLWLCASSCSEQAASRKGSMVMHHHEHQVGQTVPYTDEHFVQRAPLLWHDPRAI